MVTWGPPCVWPAPCPDRVNEAPFFEDVADGPAGGVAFWATAADGVKIRVGHWPCADARGTILLFPGRTEYIEKYGRAAKDFAERGYTTLCIDWRGQGLADRANADRGLGHVDSFSDFQADVDAALRYAQTQRLPRPFYMIGHSMGGCIGLRALHEGLPVKAAVFSAPMWGIAMSGVMRPAAWALSSVARRVGLGTRIAPGQSTATYVERVLLPENELTTDSEMFGYMQDQLAAHPDLALGGPSLRWLNEALIEMRKLARMQSPAYPCVTFLGTDETIVDTDRVRDRMARWPGGRLEVVEGARHEVMMEAPAIRTRIFDQICAHFDAHR